MTTINPQVGDGTALAAPGSELKLGRDGDVVAPTDALARQAGPHVVDLVRLQQGRELGRRLWRIGQG